jgi:pteridine reductase
MPESNRQPVALVTGGARRVGNVVVRELARRGYRVAVHAHHSLDAARTTATDIEGEGGEALVVQGDVSREDDVRRIVDEVRQRFSAIDALVNCAAIWEPTALEATTAEDVRRHLEVNTLGTWLCCQQVGLAMVEQPDGGAIVNLGDWAIARPYVDFSAYFPSKGAIPALTKSFAVELARRNPRIRVNAVLPGPVMLPPDMPEAERQAVINATLVRREGSPQHVSHAVVFLLENDFVTGVCLPVDGGRTIHS